MKIAVEGCSHGELDEIYKHIEELETRNGYKVDVLLICGDFEAIRNHHDLQCMAVPPKYRRLGDFAKYYTGERQAPILTIVIGGNHEASNYFWELYHGGWVAPNIFFLGHAGVIQINGIRIAGASGIFKPQDFRQGYYEKLPYNPSMMRSIYHIREYNIRRLSLLSTPDIFLSHDWPQGIEHHGDLNGLLRRKPFFRKDVETGALGSPPLMGLLGTLQPAWWFSAHLHVRFQATVVHDVEVPEAHGSAAPARNPEEIDIADDMDDDSSDRKDEAEKKEDSMPIDESPNFSHENPDEILLEDEEDEVHAPPPPPAPRRETKFLALDKCLPKRQYLEVVDVSVLSQFQGLTSPTLGYDPEWLSIVKAFQPYFSSNRRQLPFPDEAQARDAVKKERAWVEENIPQKITVDSLGDKAIWRIDSCQTFTPTAPGPSETERNQNEQPRVWPNPQTDAFCAMLEIPNTITPKS